MVISPSGAAPALTRGRGKNRPNKSKHPRRGRKNAKSYQRNKGKNIGQAPRKWIQIDRKPGPRARFMVPTWVPIDELTPEERSKYVPEAPAVQQQPSASSAGIVAQHPASGAITTANSATPTLGPTNSAIAPNTSVSNPPTISVSMNIGPSQPPPTSVNSVPMMQQRPADTVQQPVNYVASGVFPTQQQPNGSMAVGAYPPQAPNGNHPTHPTG